MEELVKLVSQKTGLPEAQAKKAVETVLDFLKKKLPEPFGSQIEAALEGGASGDIAKGLKGLLG